MTTLTEQAKQAPKRTIHKITPQIVELALAWAKDEVSITQVKKVLAVSENNKAYSIMARALKEKIRSSFLENKPSPPGKPISTIKSTEVHDQKSIKNSLSISDIAPGRY